MVLCTVRLRLTNVQEIAPVLKFPESEILQHQFFPVENISFNKARFDALFLCVITSSTQLDSQLPPYFVTNIFSLLCMEVWDFFLFSNMFLCKFRFYLFISIFLKWKCLALERVKPRFIIL